jgi:four helix bundle protein
MPPKSLESEVWSLKSIMPTFKRLEDIQAWQKARQVTRMIYGLTTNGMFAKDFGLRSQIQRASVSIMANIAEGFGRRSDKEFANFLNMAHGSVAETQSHLYVALDLTYIDQDSFTKLNELLDEVSRMTLALAQHLRGSQL